MTMTVAMLLSCDTFESFFGDVLKLDRERYLATYRNDWSWYYARGLLENGIKPILYIPSLGDGGLHETDTGISVRFLPVANWYKPLAGLRRAFRATRWSLYAQERVNAMSFLGPLREALAADGASLLYSQEYWNGRFDHLVHRVSVPVVAADHGGLAQGVVQWFKGAAMRRAAMLHCQTPDECSQVNAFGGRTHLQPNSCDTAQFFPDPTAVRTKTILTVARLTDKQKRTSDLIRAMTKLSKDWTLDIVGTGPDQQMLATLAIELGVADRVHFHGFQPRDAVRTFVRQCGVYAMPSFNEGVCLALLEAMACGASVVASRIRAFTPLISHGENGHLIPVGNPDAIATAVEAAWQNRDALGQAAVATVQARYDSKTLFAKLAASIRTSVRDGGIDASLAGMEAGAVV
ncbi:MAG: glycosyltransferase family 1 protein [Phycisphaerales bacterium]|nr:glycosyltransferase family 1 protein [Phycisphaerales bacterium]